MTESEANKALEATPERITQVLSVFKSANCQDETGNQYRSVGVDEVIIAALTRLSSLEPIIQELVEAQASAIESAKLMDMSNIETKALMGDVLNGIVNRIAKIGGVE